MNKTDALRAMLGGEIVVASSGIFYYYDFGDRGFYLNSSIDKDDVIDEMSVDVNYIPDNGWEVYVKPKQKFPFKPFDRILVRRVNPNMIPIWEVAFFSHVQYTGILVLAGNIGNVLLDWEIAFYEGNEEAVGDDWDIEDAWDNARLIKSIEG